MLQLDRKLLLNFVGEELETFEKSLVGALQTLQLEHLLQELNPYYAFVCGQSEFASNFVKQLIDDAIARREKKLFEDLLRELAIFASLQIWGASRSLAKEIDFEFKRAGTYYLVSVRSNHNWGNPGQHASLRHSFVEAVKVLRQSKHTEQVQPVLGICYGKNRPTNNGEYLKLTGQSFWYFLSRNKDLYTDIIEPIGFEAKKHNDKFEKEKARVYNNFTGNFINEFCPGGLIDWEKLVQMNSGNLTQAAISMLDASE